MSEQKNDYRALMKKALLEIKELKSELNASKKRQSEAIAIVGASCRFPGGAHDTDSYWDILLNGRDVISEVPADRWNGDDYYDPDPDVPGKICSLLGGYLSQPVSAFDARFFGISPREAESMDPQQRLLLELCWEALEHANMVPGDLFKSNSGVFMGISSLDNATRIIGEAPLTDIDGYYGTGIALAPVAGRISYYFGFTGPSFVVDTACSSSLLSLHLACESLRRRECNMALGGGIQLLTHPGVSIAFTKAHMLSVDGRCKTFDASANGYTRGEGGGVLVLKRLSDAEKDGDSILGLIRGSAVNQDGSSGGLTVPSGPSQEAVVRQAMANGNVDPSHVNYIEAHGTGTPLGDPIEIGALASVFGKYRSVDQPLRIGSVKTNMGHLEAGAGIASAIKVMLSLRHRTIAPHLNFNHPNPLIPWKEIPVSVPVAAEPWESVAPGVPLTAGISSFGFSGTNVHLVMSEAPAEVPGTDTVKNTGQDPVTVKTSGAEAEKTSGSETEDGSAKNRLLVLSAQNRPALRELAQRYIERLQSAGEQEWPSVAYTAATARTRFKHRLALSASTSQDAATELEQFLSGDEAADVSQGACEEGSRPKTALLFTGQGSQYSGMGKELYRVEPVFKDIIDRCDTIMQPYIGQPLTELLWDEANSEKLGQTRFTQPALYALEVALAELWRSRGGRVDAVTGHSVGEYAAAAVAGVFSVEDGAMLISERAKLMQALPSGGGMMALFATLTRVDKLLKSWEMEDVVIAAFNGPANIVLSGPEKSLSRVEKLLEREEIDFRALTVSHAFHSVLMEPMLKPYRKVAEQVQFSKPKIPVYSNLTGRPEEKLMSDSDYWVRHIREPVRFEEGIQALMSDGFNLFIEAGPKGTLLSLGRRIAEKATEVVLSHDAVSWVPMIKPGRSESRQFTLALGSFWCRGGEPVWENPGGPLTQLPTYPFQRKRYWRDVLIDGNRLNAKQNGSAPAGRKELSHPLLGRTFRSPLVNERFYETLFSKAEIPMLDEHRIFGELVVAGASHLALIIGAAEMEFEGDGVQLKDIVFPQALVVPEEGERTVQLMISPDVENRNRTFRLVSFLDPKDSVAVHASGSMAPESEESGVSAGHSELKTLEWEEIESRCKRRANVEDVYRVQEQRHIVVGESYRWLQSLKLGEGEAVADLVQPEVISHSSDFSLHPGLIDSCFGVLVMTSDIDVEETFIPVGMEQLRLHRPAGDEPLKVFARLRSGKSDRQQMVGDIVIETKSGKRVAEFIGLEGRRAGKEALLALSGAGDNGLYERVWMPVEATDSTNLRAESNETWLFYCDETGFAVSVAEMWRKAGRRVIEVQAGDELTHVRDDLHTVDPADLSQMKQLLDSVKEELKGDKFAGCINFWPLDVDDHAAGDVAGETGTRAEHFQRQAVEPALNLVRALSGQPVSERLLVVTRQSCSVSSDDPLLSLHQASLWGVVKGLMAEQPELNTSVIDIESTDSSESFSSEQFTRAVNRVVEGESGLACRKSGIYAERLVPYRFGEKATESLSTEGCFLITGGTGALGLTLADWLVSKGVRSLLLLSRNDPGPKALKRIESFRSAGATVQLLKVDVSDYDALSSAMSSHADHFKNLKGLFHLAGTLDDGPVSQMEWPQFYQPFPSKVEGALNLHRLTADYPLDYFVLFSSMASLTGSAGQANYAAANAVLDALATQRKQSGLSTVSLNWGPWESSGMAASLDEVSRRRIESRGIGFLSDKVALDHLESLLGPATPAQIGIFDVDWGRFDSGNSSLLKELTKGLVSEKVVDNSAPDLLEKLKEIVPVRRESLLHRELNQMISKSLKLQKGQEIDPRERLFDLGVDSLIAVELKNRLQRELGVQVSSTLLFDYPTVEALVKYLLQDLLAEALAEPAAGEEMAETGGTVTGDADHGKANTAKNVTDTNRHKQESAGKNGSGKSMEVNEDMSDEDAEAALLEELSRMKGEGS
ncbi:MAG: type I polyketide synthase [Balneolaceae bacterium]